MSDSSIQNLQPLIDLRGANTSLTPSRARLLEALASTGSISAAARAVGMSYKGAWDAVAALNTLADQPLVETELGGVGGGGARLTDTGRRLLTFYQALVAMQRRVLTGADGGDLDQLLNRINNMMLRTSARNQYEGLVTGLEVGAVNSEVTLQLDGGDTLVAIITNKSVRTLGLVLGASAIGLVKSSFVILAVADDAVRTSARNRLHGVVASCQGGEVNAEVVLTLSAGKQIVSTVTNESVRAMGIQQGLPMTAMIKASHVILAVAG